MLDEETSVGVIPPGPDLGDLADPARDRALVTLDAGLGVVDGPQTVVSHEFPFFEDVPILVELGLGAESVRQVVEARGGLDGLAVRDGQDQKGRDPRRKRSLEESHWQSSRSELGRPAGRLVS